MSADRAALRRLGRRTRPTTTPETLPGLVARWRVERDVENVQRLELWVDLSEPLRDAVLTTLTTLDPVPDDAPRLTVREAAVVSWLLDLITKYGVNVPAREDSDREAARASGYGMRCGAGHTGCSPRGWEYVAMARLFEYATGDGADVDPLTHPDQPHPFTPGGLLGPWPSCFARYVHATWKWTLP